MTSTDHLMSVSAFGDVAARAARAARATLPLVSATLHALYPTGAYLVVTRPETYLQTGLYLHSIRDADGTVLCGFTGEEAGGRLDKAPPELEALWGDFDPRDPEDVERLLDRLDQQVPHDLLDVLPEPVLHPGEEDAEEAPLGLRLAPGDAPRCALCFRLVAEHVGRVCERPAMTHC